jgi:hypothetical protein
LDLTGTLVIRVENVVRTGINAAVELRGADHADAAWLEARTLIRANVVLRINMLRLRESVVRRVPLELWRDAGARLHPDEATSAWPPLKKMNGQAHQYRSVEQMLNDTLFMVCKFLMTRQRVLDDCRYWIRSTLLGSGPRIRDGKLHTFVARYGDPWAELVEIMRCNIRIASTRPLSRFARLTGRPNRNAARQVLQMARWRGVVTVIRWVERNYPEACCAPRD